MRGTTDENQRDGASIPAGDEEAGPTLGGAREQDILRVLLVSAASAYLLFSVPDHARSVALTLTAAAAILGALVLLAFGMFLPQQSIHRRMFTILFDTVAITGGMQLGGEAGAPLYLLYFVSAFGNGFRFGLPFLYVSTSLSLIGYPLVVMNSPFWLGHMALAVGFWVGLAALPVYVAIMLKRLHGVIRRSGRATREQARFLLEAGLELRPPLNQLLGASDLLRESSLSRGQREFADTICESANSAIAVLHNIVDYAAIAGGKFGLRTTEFDLHNVLNGAVRLLRDQADKRSVRLGLQIDPQTPYQLTGAPAQLRQVLSNLITNALAFARYGQLNVRVRPLYANDSGTMLRFEVEQHGNGEAARLLARLTDRTKREATTISYDGTALRAVVAVELVKLMGGTIGVENQEADRSTVWFELPFGPSPAEGLSATSLQHTRVLLISDARSPNIGVVTGRLREWGVQFETNDSASGAFVRAESELRRGHAYHVIIVDKLLIDIDARQFARALRKVTSSTDTALVLITREDNDLEHGSLLEAGYSCLLSSPVDQKLLFNALHSAPVVERHGGERIVPLRPRIDRARTAARSRILVAEDNPTSQKFIARVLERAGHEVDLVHNGEEALDALECGDYNLVMLDMHMPVMDGVQTAKLYRFIYPNNSLPFVMLTANATTEAKLECESAGIETFLTKPIEASRLLEIIERILERHSGGDPSELRTDRDPVRQRERPATNEVFDGAPVLNLASLQEVESLGRGSDFFHELIQGFIRDGNGLLEKMQESLSREDYADFRDASHALKGNAGSIGAVKLYKSCLQVERMSRADFELLGVQTLIDIRGDFRQACAALIEYSKKLGNNASN